VVYSKVRATYVEKKTSLKITLKNKKNVKLILLLISTWKALNRSISAFGSMNQKL